MPSKGKSDWFWAKQAGLAFVLIAIATAIIYLNRQNAAKPKPEGEPEARSIATGLSAFYRDFRMSSDQPMAGANSDFVINLEAPDTTIDERLQSIAPSFKPADKRWSGERKHRTFKAGSTLKTAITEYARNEGMDVVWDLNQDFIIKHQFQLNTTVVGSLNNIVTAIDSNFNGKVKAWMCPEQRRLVITTAETQFLLNNCRRTG